MYFHGVLLIHFRPFLKLKLTSSTISPRAICAEASRNITSLVRVYKNLYTLRRVPVFVPYLLLTAELNMLVQTRWWPDEDPLAQNARSEENLQYLSELSLACPFAKRAITICKSFRDRWDGNTNTDIKIPEFGSQRIPRLAWDHVQTFFHPDEELMPAHTVKTDPIRQQSLSATGIGICLFPLQTDPLRKLLQSPSSRNEDQSKTARLRKNLEAWGLEEA